LEEKMGISKSAVLSVAAAFGLASGAALAAYPEKPVKILVGFSAGGGTDTTSRGFASYMHEAESMADSPPISLTYRVPQVKKLPKWFSVKRPMDILFT
jgi:tripartite-type tricarboxylate transporter receptor subunit TctC